MVGVPKTTLRFEDLLGGLTGRSIQLCTWPWFVPGKAYKAKLAEGKGTWGEDWREPGTSIQTPLPAESYGMHLIPHNIQGQHV